MSFQAKAIKILLEDLYTRELSEPIAWRVPLEDSSNGDLEYIFLWNGEHGLYVLVNEEPEEWAFVSMDEVEDFIIRCAINEEVFIYELQSRIFSNPRPPSDKSLEISRRIRKSLKSKKLKNEMKRISQEVHEKYELPVKVSRSIKRIVKSFAKSVKAIESGECL